MVGIGKRQIGWGKNAFLTPPNYFSGSAPELGATECYTAFFNTYERKILALLGKITARANAAHRPALASPTPAADAAPALIC